MLKDFLKNTYNEAMGSYWEGRENELRQDVAELKKYGSLSSEQKQGIRNEYNEIKAERERYR